MQKKRLIYLLVAVVILATLATLYFVRQSRYGTGGKGSIDSLPAIEQITPEIKALSEEIRSNPNKAELYYSRGNAYFGFGNLKFAQKDFLVAFRLDSNSATYALGLSECYFDMNEVNQAIEVLENYQRRIPNHPDILFNLAIDYFLLPEPKYQQSILLLNELLKDNLQNANAYFYKGLIYKESGDTAKAVSSFQTCTEVDPDYYDAWMQLGLLYAAKGDPLAIRYYDNAIAVNDSSQEAEYAKAKFFQDVGNITDAIEYYRRLIVKDPQDADALYNLATIYFGVDSLDKAYRFFDLAIKQSPGKAYAHYGKGLCAEKMGKKEEALAYFKQAIALDPQLTFIEEKIQALNAE